MDNEENKTYEEDTSSLIIYIEDTTTNVLVLDSGASFHARYCKTCFRNNQANNFGKVYLVDDEPCNIIGKGDVLINMKIGNSWLLKNVRHVSQLRRNLISARKFQHKELQHKS